MLWVVICSFISLSRVPLCGNINICLSSHLLREIGLFQFGVISNKAKTICKPLGGQRFTLLLGKYLGKED